MFEGISFDEDKSKRTKRKNSHQAKVNEESDLRRSRILVKSGLARSHKSHQNSLSSKDQTVGAFIILDFFSLESSSKFEMLSNAGLLGRRDALQQESSR